MTFCDIRYRHIPHLGGRLVTFCVLQALYLFCKNLCVGFVTNTSIIMCIIDVIVSIILIFGIMLKQYCYPD